MTRRLTVRLALGAAVAALAIGGTGAGASVAASASPSSAASPDGGSDPYAQQSLHDLAQQHGKYIGNAVDNSEIQDTEYADLVAAEVGSITPGNALKWDATEPRRGEFDFTRADEIIDFAEANGQRVRGHTLIWHSQTPDWVQNLEAAELRTALREHTTKLVDRYRGRITDWDVVNEPLNEDGSFRDSFWFRTLGEDYIAEAFRAAHAADPDARLYINDYNIDGLGAKSDGMYDLVTELLRQGVPIHGVGIQGHLSTQYGFPDQMRQNIQRFADLGLEVAITELDVRMPTPADEQKLATQADYYAQVVDACLAVDRCAGITLWSLSDRYSWIPDAFPGEGAAHLTDQQLRPKPAYHAFRAALGADG